METVGKRLMKYCQPPIPTEVKQTHTFRNPKHRFLNKRFGFQMHIMACFFLHFYYTNNIKTTVTERKKNYYLPSHHF